jgi:hypothetical protein
LTTSKVDALGDVDNHLPFIMAGKERDKRKWGRGGEKKRRKRNGKE